MKRLLAAILVSFVTASSVFALTPVPVQGGPVAVGQAMAQKDDAGKVAIIVAPNAQPPSTAVSVGTIGADALTWIGTVMIPVLGAFLTKWLMALAKKAGIDASQAASDKLDSMIENGLHDALSKAGADLTGKLTVDVKNAALASAVQYAQTHGADTIKALSGVDPNDPAVIAALQARAAKALNGIAPTGTAPAAPPAT